VIEPRVDAYGRYADASALADYLELLALSEVSPSRSDVADQIRDNVWTVRAAELFDLPGAELGGGPDQGFGAEGEDEPIDEDAALEDEAAQQATRVFDVLEERSDLLDDRYPFDIDDRVVARPEAVAHEPYLVLLAITAAHAYRVGTPSDPRNQLERFVTLALRDKGLAAADLAEAGRREANFSDALTAIGADAGLSPAPDDASTRTNAQDEGVDTVAHLTLGDLRAGHWTFIGQATCASSEEWDRKFSEPSPSQFAPLLGSLVLPFPFLAVPHHIDRRHLHWLTRRRGVVLDRIRLARMRHAIDVDERALLEAIQAEDVLTP
jgi:hypothetical protein